MNITDIFVKNIYEFSKQKFDQELVNEVKKCVLDYMACTYLGAYTQNNRIYEYMESFEDAEGKSLVIGFEKRLAAPLAAFINAMNAHLLEFDDGQRFGAPHLSAVNMSALIAVYNGKNMDAEDFIRGVIVSYEATIKLSMLLQPEHKKKGFHSSCTAGTIGCALGIAAALKFDYEGFKRAASAAATTAFGVLEALDDNSELKPYNIAHTSMEGVMAAVTAKVGLNVPNDILGGDRGYFKAIGYTYNVADVEEFLNNNDRMICTIYRKPYASCRHCHPAIEAAQELKKAHNISIEKIERILIETYDLALKGHDHKEVTSVSSAKMSMPYSVAVMLCTDQCGYQSFSKALIEDEKIQSVIEKIEIVADEELSQKVPKERSAKVTIWTEGHAYTYLVRNPKGEPENPITFLEIENKFKEFAKIYGLSDVRISEMIDRIKNIDNSFDEFYKLLAECALY